ncbi:MAG: replicative DNA helicase [Phototrophicales bacterium]|nr:MAG: replicative DNA helicase [Phototrophicales bacterium]
MSEQPAPQPASSTLTPTEYLPPHSVEAEQALLGAILINPDTISEVISFLDADDFYIWRNGRIYEAMCRLHERRDAIDVLTVANELNALNALDDVGGSTYLTYLVGQTPSSIYAVSYGHIVERAAIRRRMLEAASEIAKLANAQEMNVEEIVEHAEATLFAVTDRNTKKDMVPMRRAVSDYYNRIEYLYENRDEPIGVPTGFTDLDKLLGGMQRSDLLILAARPGMGKTSLILNVAVNAARIGGARVAIFSLEMSNEQLVQRLVAAETGIGTQQLRLGQLDQYEWERFVQATESLSKLPLFLDDTPAITPLHMRGKCRRLYREHGLDLVIVDYLQLMTLGGNTSGRSENRVQEVSAISRNLKELARELNVPVLAASQLSRAVESRGDKRPVLSDLRESGSIEQDADVVMFIYRDEVYNEDTDRPNQADVIIAKHRNGPIGTVSLYFRKELTQFANLRHTDIDLSGY